ncbi:MAG: rod shape-determining protein MreD [Planctomycetota bacterium]|jgi:rod shape-determining protein MreD
MRWFRFTVFVLVVTLIQAGLVDIISLINVRPDLLLILLVFFSIYCDTSEAIISSFAIGFAADLIGPAMGPQMISFGLFGTLLAYLHRFIAIREMPYQSLAIAVIGLLTGALAHLLMFLKGQPTPPNIFTVLLGASLYSAIIGPFLFLPSAWVMRIKTHRFVGS